MPIFKATATGLTSLRQVLPGPDLYELEIEKLLWDNLEAFYAEDLFPISRQPQIPTGGRPDVVSITRTPIISLLIGWHSPVRRHLCW